MIDFDVETNGLQPHSGKQEAFLWIFLDDEGNAEAIQYTPLSGGNPENRERIQAWFDRAKEEGIRAWNAKFDRAFAEQAGFDIPGDGMWHDGMIYAHAINERRSVALKAVAKELFGDEAADDQMKVKNWLKEERARRKKQATEDGTELIEPNYSDVPMEIMEPYGLEDVILTRKIADQYLPIIEQTPDLKRVVDFEHGVLDALYAVEKRGIPASATDYRHLEQECISNLDALEERIDELAAEGGVEDFNPKSSPQIIAALKGREADLTYATVKDGDFEGPWIDLAKKDPHRAKEIWETGKGFSADAESLRNIDDELAATILEFRSEFKVLSTYVRPMIGRHYDKEMRMWKEPFLSEDGRIHANYRQLGARTGRMSCSDPNIQNQPRDDLRLRYCIRAEPGYKLVTCDLSNIEMVLFAAYCGNGKLLEAVRAGEDLHELTAEMLGFRDRERAGGNFESARQQGKTYNFCRPLDVEILTQRGWLTHDEVKPGDLTVGYNAETRRSEWTEITAVHHFDDAELVRLSTGSWSATATPEHTWVTEKMRRPEIQRMVQTKDLNSEDRIILSAEAEGLPLEQQQNVQRLGDVYRDDDWEQRVILMSPAERRAWLAGIALGEGSVAPGSNANPNAHVWTIAQNEGPLYEAIKLAIYLEGYRPSTGLQHSNGKVPCKWVRCAKPNVTGQKLVKENVGRGPVWCVTTKLGSWTGRENGEISLTGNSRIYGGGLRTIQKSFRCDRDHARLLKKRFDQAYPEVKRLTDRIQYRLYDQGYISDKLISGRRFRVEPSEAYKGTNYLVQGTAASLLKEAVVKLHQDGVPIVALVHDEIIAHVPEAEAESARDLIIQRMTENEDVRNIVPLSADGVICDHWSDAKPLKDGSLFVPNWVSQ